MKKSCPIILCLMLFQFCGQGNKSDFSPTQLKCDNLENPAGTGKNPDFN
jgi:hypothetical protein